MQSVIVYRNPVEAAFWESMMNGGFFIFGAVVLLAVFGAFLYVAINMFAREQWRRCRATWGGEIPHPFVLWVDRHNGKISVAVTIVLAVLALYYGHV